jgi:hypothetical protein
MGFKDVEEAIAWLEKSNADLEPELLSANGARALLDEYARMLAGVPPPRHADPSWSGS